MEKLKDILYENSDIFLGLIVIFVMLSVVSPKLYASFQLDSNPRNDIYVSEDNSSSEEEPIEKIDTKTEEVVYFEIKSGEFGSKIGQNLKESGLIDSVDEFLKVLRDSNLENSIKVGAYKIKSGSSLDEIISIITR
ncbi:MltG/YceG/YrrL family protein [Alkalithermobacter paradoxus]|uniref:YceG-like family protein n=1 Tax=Alkalithermobacter paradoxus TaxID=29349 RepID=A0A1V4I741_9FIRM|nr:YceG-like family protein [[Clostridium] thermoalcaliphilum]